jgi:hypothetical protein
MAKVSFDKKIHQGEVIVKRQIGVKIWRKRF